jgi:hypothetical protein
MVAEGDAGKPDNGAVHVDDSRWFLRMIDKTGQRFSPG